MYEREAPLSIDPKRLARLCGCTHAAFNKAVQALVEEGKISNTENGLWNERVQKEIKKRTEKRKTASENASKRWEKIQQNQWGDDAAAMQAQCGGNANQKPDTRDIRGGGGSAHAREADPPISAPQIDQEILNAPSEREQILAAVGADPVSGMVGPNGKQIGGLSDMQEFERWKSDLGLSFEEVILVVREVMNAKRDGPPGTFSYFTKAMQRHAGRKHQQALAPIEGAPHERNLQPQTGRRGQTAAGRAHEGLIAAFAGTIPDEP